MKKVLIALLLASAVPAYAVPIKVAEAPFNDLALTVMAIETAKTYLLVNIYDLSSKEIAAALIERINAGVHVEVLEEGQPVGGIGPAGREIQAQLARAMAKAAGHDDHLYIMTSHTQLLGKRRFHYDHAKYIVADGENLLIGSENYSPTGNPVPGSVGNRGWEVFIHDADTTMQFQQMFRSDADLSKGDIIDITLAAKDGSTMPAVDSTGFDRLKMIARTLPIFEAAAVHPIIAPNNSLKGLLALLDGARKSIDIQQMTLDSSWGPGAKSPLVLSLLAAARRGVQVRALLNDESTFDHDGIPAKRKNVETLKILMEFAKNERLPLEVRIANVKAMGVDYIHNKGALVDGGLTLVSSINWDQNAVMNNREAGMLIESSDIFSHYESLFEHDWAVSAQQ
ncbi:MAG: hypothetical protein HY074_14510 [Deltaproteobacteria bacterium]|nr:hypothetical protein [Deltaproteobacteria bacterium]